MNKSKNPIKHDTPSHWAKAVNFIPGVGELIIYDAEGDNGDVATPRFKIGDGKRNVNDLPFVKDEKRVDGCTLIL